MYWTEEIHDYADRREKESEWVDTRRNEIPVTLYNKASYVSTLVNAKSNMSWQWANGCHTLFYSILVARNA